MDFAAFTDPDNLLAVFVAVSAYHFFVLPKPEADRPAAADGGSGSATPTAAAPDAPGRGPEGP